MAWGAAGVIVKVCDHVHELQFQDESGWVREAIGQPKYEQVHGLDTPMPIRRNGEPLTADNNGSTYLVFRRGSQRHARMAQTK